MKWLAIILTAIFTGAKLAKVISWSWWLVFSPVIIYYGLIIGIVVISLLVASIVQCVIGIRGKWNNESSGREN
jgi:hypothetical protein